MQAVYTILNFVYDYPIRQSKAKGGRKTALDQRDLPQVTAYSMMSCLLPSLSPFLFPFIDLHVQKERQGPCVDGERTVGTEAA